MIEALVYIFCRKLDVILLNYNLMCKAEMAIDMQRLQIAAFMYKCN